MNIFDMMKELAKRIILFSLNIQRTKVKVLLRHLHTTYWRKHYEIIGFFKTKIAIEKLAYRSEDGDPWYATK